MKRYEKIIPSFEEFKEKTKKPQPTEIRINSLKSNYEEIIDFLIEKEISYKVRSKNKNFLRVEENVSESLYHWLGLFYIQEFTSGIPPMLLELSPSDDVLDMCAAPGSKTTQIAAIMKNRGEVVANDPATNRIRALMGNLYRMGVVNTQVIQYRGQAIPEEKKFDKVLVDAPCSGEGNVRKDKRSEAVTKSELESLCPIQEQLLKKAIKLTKKEGIIVYSTCTFAPEENEMVIEKILSKDVELQQPELELKCSNGITKWKNRKLNPELEKCKRIYPHQVDSGGIFIAKIKKKS